MGTIPLSDPRQVAERASRALGKIDAWGERGITLLSVEEIEAMALALVILGLKATPPGGEPSGELVAPRPAETIQETV